MFSALLQLILLPLKLVLVLIELMGRTLAILVGLGMFGVGAMLCVAGPFILIGAPLCLLAVLLVVKAF